MRKTTPMTFGQLWDDFLKDKPKIARHIAEAQVADVWPVVAGVALTSYTESVSVVKGVMYVKFSSAAARNEAFMRRSQLKDAINAALGKEVVKTIIVK
jgi:predicted nucleic acid-binding Zn ribbon protein